MSYHLTLDFKDK